MTPVDVEVMAAWFLTVLVVGLAGYRAARAVTIDSLFMGTRERVQDWAYRPDGRDRTVVRGKVGDILTCAYCQGFWWCLIALWAWQTDPYGLGRWVVLGFAAAGVQCRLQGGSARDETVAD